MSPGDVGDFGRVGLGECGEAAYLDKLPEDVEVRREGFDEVPMWARLANAPDVFAFARDANDRLLLL